MITSAFSCPFDSVIISSNKNNAYSKNLSFGYTFLIILLIISKNISIVSISNIINYVNNNNNNLFTKMSFYIILFFS